MDILLPLLYRKDAVIGNKVRYTRNGKTYYRALPGKGKEDQPKVKLNRKSSSPKTNLSTAAKVAGIVGVATLGSAIAAGATTLSIPPVVYAAQVNKYRSHMAKNREEIVAEGDKLAQEFQNGIAIIEEYKTKYPDLFKDNGKLNKKAVWKMDKKEEDELYANLPGFTEKQREYLTDPNNKSYRLGYANAALEDSPFHQIYNNSSNKKSITIVANGFDGLESDKGAKSVITDIQNTRKSKNNLDTDFDSHVFIPVSNEGFAPDNDLSGLSEAFKTNLQNGQNEVAQRMAIQAYAYSKAFPDKQINLVGYSGAGMATNEVAEQFEKLKIKTRVVNYGSPWFGASRPPLQGKYVQSITFGTPFDHATPLGVVANGVNINDVKDHFTYLSNSKVRALTKDFLNNGVSASDIQAKSDNRGEIGKKELSKKKKRRLAIIRGIKAGIKKAASAQKESDQKKD